MTIAQEVLRKLLQYDEETGVFTRLGTGRKITPKNKAGYVVVYLFGGSYYAHRLAWLYVNGSMPAGQIDHINGDKSDNRIANLRVVSAALNSQNRPAQSNNKTGFKGVSFNTRRTRFHACIRVAGKTIHLGNFVKAEDAAAAYALAAARYHSINPFAQEVPA